MYCTFNRIRPQKFRFRSGSSFAPHFCAPTGMSGKWVPRKLNPNGGKRAPPAARGATMWLAVSDLHRSALSGDQLILVVKRVCSRVQSQLRIGLSICWLPTYDGTFQGDLSAPPHIQKGCCGLARRTVCEHTLPQRFCVDTFWTRQHM